MTDGEDEEEEGGVPGVVRLLTERGRGLELISCGATLKAMGWSSRGLGAPAVVCWRISWWCATRWPGGQDSCCLTRAWGCAGQKAARGCMKNTRNKKHLFV